MIITEERPSISKKRPNLPQYIMSITQGDEQSMFVVSRGELAVFEVYRNNRCLGYLSMDGITQDINKAILSNGIMNYKIHDDYCYGLKMVTIH